jgi:meiotically up-regulated gene 157 (Mug157) protein
MDNNGPYKFERTTSWATDGVPLGGYGYPAKKNGLIHSMFRPSDDATIFPYLIPSNFFALYQLMNLLEIVRDDRKLRGEVADLVSSIRLVLLSSVLSPAGQNAKIIPYEINGSGSMNFMDDANIPSLLSLPYLTPMSLTDKDYLETRKYILSSENPFFFKGKAGEGIGGPHVGLDFIWPMSIIMRGLTSTDANEISGCIGTLQRSHAGTGFMHESFHKDDATRYTRKWFAWANTLFGEFIWKVYRENKKLLD